MLRVIKAPCPIHAFRWRYSPLSTSRYNNVYGQGGYPEYMIGSNVCSPDASEALYEIGFGLTQRFLRCSKSADDGAYLYCLFTCRLKTLGYKSKWTGSRMTKSCSIKYIDENFSKYKSTRDIFKNNKNKIEKLIVTVALATTIHYMLYCKMFCL